MRLALLLLLALALPARAQFPVPVVGPSGADWEVTEIEVAPDGAAYVLGLFETELTLGPQTLMWAAPNPTGFLARFSDAGVLEWAHVLEARRQTFGDEAAAAPKRIAVLPGGDVALLGTITLGLEIDLDPGPGTATVAASDVVTAFVVRYGADGAYAWSGAASFGGAAANTSAMGLGADGSRVFALLPAASDADPGPATTPTTAPALVAMDAATGATAYVQETALPAGGTFSPAVAHDLAAGGGSVYVLGHALPFSGQNTFTLSHHAAASGAETWTFTTTNGRDLLTDLDVGAGGALLAAGPLSSSATGIALDPAAPGTITLSRNGDFRTALARYTPAGALDWAEAVEVNVGAWGGGIAVEGGEVFASGFGHLRAYAEADGALLRSLPAEVGRPNLRDVGAGPGRVVSYVDPEGNPSFEIQGVPPGLPPTLLVQFERSDLSLVVSPPVGAEAAPEADAVALGAPRPHPIAGQAEVTVSLAEPGPARLALHDALGREVRLLAAGPLPAGDSWLAVETAGLAPGAYVLVLAGAGGRAARPVVVVR